MTKAQTRQLKGTPLAIIEAAERLFGQHGIENVSLRQIRLEACAGNNSAISYHFSDREKLVRAIWEYRLPILDRARRVKLDDIYAKGLQHDPQMVLRALIMPSYDLLDSSGVHRYAAFFRHALRWQQGTAIRNSQLNATPASNEALALFHALRPDASPQVLDYRLRYGTCMFFDMIFDRDVAIAGGQKVVGESIFLAEGFGMLEALCLFSARSSSHSS